MVRYYWSRVPGQFVNKLTGKRLDYGLNFRGSQEEWNETLVETMIDIRHQVWRDRGEQIPCTVTVDQEAMDVLRTSVTYRPDEGIISGFNLVEGKIDGSQLAVSCTHTGARLGEVVILD